MPQIAKGGKFIFGWSVINPEGCVRIPKMTFQEYDLSAHNAAILSSGSKKSGGFCVSNYTLMNGSIMRGLFLEHPEIEEYSIGDGECIKYKGRLYCWTKIHPEGILKLPVHTMKTFGVQPADRLLSIRGSNIAFVFAVRGPIIEAAKNFKGVIEEYRCG